LWSSGQSSWYWKEMYCFLWGTNWIYICYVEENRPPLWSTHQSSWLQIQMPEFDSRRYQIFWEAVSLERSPLSLVSTNEELLGRKSSGSSLEIREYGHKGSSLWPRGNLYVQKLTLNSPTNGDRSVGTVRSDTQATEFSLVLAELAQKITVVYTWNIRIYTSRILRTAQQRCKRKFNILQITEILRYQRKIQNPFQQLKNH
jgi:hypothetical protein